MCIALSCNFKWYIKNLPVQSALKLSTRLQPEKAFRGRSCKANVLKCPEIEKREQRGARQVPVNQDTNPHLYRKHPRVCNTWRAELPHDTVRKITYLIYL